VVRRNGLLEAVRAMERRISGDIVLAYGVSVASLAVGLLAKLRRHVPLILDMPEWEVHDHYKWQRRFSRSLMITRNLLGPGWSDSHSFKYRYMLDHVTHLADERTVCCLLQRRYGEYYFQGPDTNQFDPATFDKMAIRRKWGIPRMRQFFSSAATRNQTRGWTRPLLHSMPWSER
jgi:hypothetical protein